MINVDGGAHITVVFEGDQLSEKERRQLVPIEREGSVDQDLLEDSANRIEAHLRAKGTAMPTPISRGHPAMVVWR